MNKNKTAETSLGGFALFYFAVAKNFFRRIVRGIRKNA